jgi:hypothetical protein
MSPPTLTTMGQDTVGFSLEAAAGSIMVVTTGTVDTAMAAITEAAGGGPVAEASMAAVIMEAVLMEAAGTVELRAPFAFGAVGQTTASEYLSNFRPLPVAIVTRKHDA